MALDALTTRPQRSRLSLMTGQILSCSRSSDVICPVAIRVWECKVWFSVSLPVGNMARNYAAISELSHNWARFKWAKSGTFKRWLPEPKCTENVSYNIVSYLSHLVPLLPTLGRYLTAM